MVAAEQTGFSSGTPNDDDVCFAARSARNKNFLIKSLTCASRGRFVSFFVGTRRREKEKERKGLEPDGAGGDRSRKKTAPLYDARLDFAVYLVGAVSRVNTFPFRSVCKFEPRGGARAASINGRRRLIKNCATP